MSSVSFILDVSRLLSRAGRNVPTGIDRVELAYAEYLLTYHKRQTYFVALSSAGRMGVLPSHVILAFINSLIAGWNLGQQEGVVKAGRISKILKIHALLSHSLPRFDGAVFYLLVSHHHLMRESLIAKFIRNNNCYFIPMVHDLIPMEYPEYARPRERVRHETRMNTVVKLAHAVIVPTDSVGISLKALFMKANQHNTPIWTIPHGVHKQIICRSCQKDNIIKIEKPYFICLSTIEPRKNHLLLLHLWRRMVQTRGKEVVPRLILIGKRGWENENILDLLERSPSLDGVVLEESCLSDEIVASLLKFSNGLLFPSFTEGYGLPLIEAMSLSVPSICSDIPVLREVGKDIPTYLSPLDATEWEKVIDDFSIQGPLWQTQKDRLKKWSPFSWSQSVALALSHCMRLVKNI